MIATEDELINSRGIIYKITNIVNNKCYVGQSALSFKERYKNGKWWKKGSINRIIIEDFYIYGEKSFIIEIIEKNINSEFELNSMEVFYIKLNNCINPNGYNITPGGKYFKLKSNRIFKFKDPNGIIHETDNLSHFCRINRLTLSGMSLLHSGFYNRFKKWTRHDYKHPIKIFISPYGEKYYIKYGEFESFCKERGLHHFGMRQVLNGKFEQFKGWTKSND